MKKLLLSVSLLIGSFELSYASPPLPDNTDPLPVPIDEKYVPSKGRPKAPSKQYIECWYCDGVLSFDFVIPEGVCTLYVTDYATGFMTQHTFDSADHADVYVGSLPNGGALEINTESGHAYNGEIVITD